MDREAVLLMKVIYVAALAALALALGLAVHQGVDAQVESLPYYAAVWGG